MRVRYVKSEFASVDCEKGNFNRNLIFVQSCKVPPFKTTLLILGCLKFSYYLAVFFQVSPLEISVDLVSRAVTKQVLGKARFRGLKLKSADLILSNCIPILFCV